VVAIGSEARGLSRQIREMARESVRIGMEEQMESLNAAMAASIIAYHLHTLEQH
jgi:TrmH family RNA methyltransferase